jgi:ATP-dependent DNA helicase RecQ
LLLGASGKVIAMSELFDTFQSFLRGETPDYSMFVHRLRRYQEDLIGRELVLSYGLLRLTQALQYWSERAEGSADVLVLLRQVIRSYRQRLVVSVHFWQQLSIGETVSGLWSIVDSEEPTMVQLMADAWHTKWLQDTEEIDHVAQRRSNQYVLGDGLLHAMTQGAFVGYQSLAQRAAVQGCLFCHPGSTLLVTMPTGMGKSLATLLSAWHASQGGRIQGGTTLVIVPTVSLALDQQRNALRFFDAALSPEYMPQSWTGDTSLETRANIRSGIVYGTLPILYTSPEALIQSELYSICLEAASRGTINWLVVDEAHLVETWGAGFRTKFQFLAAYREQLLEHSNGQLRTLLTSATVSRKCAILLQRLFGHNDSFYRVQANRLRPEPSYWFRFSQFDSIREKSVLEALYYLPRPAILYVSKIEDANRWEEILQRRGFRRMAVFTGETPSTRRQQLVRAWSSSEIDLMIATSAFGVGIDKSDVRTIIHACLPENVDRFYQEVGRAGRDGYSAVSLLYATLDDYKVAFGMTRAARITGSQAANRWKGMRKTGRILSAEYADIMLVDTNAPPEDEPDMRRSDKNREWNEHTILLMQRAGLLRILDSREDIALTQQLLDTEASPSTRGWLQIRLLDPATIAYPENPEFIQLLEEKRQEEVDDIHSALKKMQTITEEYSKETASRCLAYELIDLYPSCARACGGCSYCRKQQIHPYEKPLPLNIDIDPGELSATSLADDLRSLMGWREALHVTWDGLRDLKTQMQLQNLLAELVGAGVQQIILPDELSSDEVWLQELVASIARQEMIPHQILTEKDIESLPLYNVPTCIVYPATDMVADQFYRRLFKQLKSWHDQHVPLVHIIHRSLVLESERGRFIDRIEGMSETQERLYMYLTVWKDVMF